MGAGGGDSTLRPNPEMMRSLNLMPIARQHNSAVASDLLSPDPSLTSHIIPTQQEQSAGLVITDVRSVLETDPSHTSDRGSPLMGSGGAVITVASSPNHDQADVVPTNRAHGDIISGLEPITRSSERCVHYFSRNMEIFLYI